MNIPEQELRSIIADEAKAGQVIALLRQVQAQETQRRKQRQKQGIRQAMEQGVSIGRPRKQVPSAFADYRAQYKEGRITAHAAAKALDIPVTTFCYWVKRAEREQE